MTIRVYDLAGAEADRRFSPNCWRTHMALAHKGLAADAVPWRFTEKEAISDFSILETGAWRERMLDLLNGLARKSKGYQV